jgi:hypothetical protein
VQATDWKGAVERAAPVVLSANPSLLIFVDGLQYSTDFTGSNAQPLREGSAPLLSHPKSHHLLPVRALACLLVYASLPS